MPDPVQEILRRAMLNAAHFQTRRLDYSVHNLLDSGFIHVALLRARHRSRHDDARHNPRHQFRHLHASSFSAQSRSPGPAWRLPLPFRQKALHRRGQLSSLAASGQMPAIAI